MTTQIGGECESCGRPLVLSTSNRNKGQPITCICKGREYHRNYGQSRRTNHHKRPTIPWHESRSLVDARTNQASNEAHKEQQAEWRGKNLDKTKDYFRKHAYGLAPGRYDEMLVEQDGNCFLCGKPMSRPHIDHNHKTKQVRKLLCGGCNMAVGIIEADPTWITRTQEYLKGDC
jgi:hypothetical protein